MPRRLLLGWLSLGLVVANLAHARPDEDSLQIEQDQRIAIIGNSLAERLQHHGWLEARLQLRYASQDPTVRNLGYAGDEIDQRLRTAGFGSPEEWLDRVGAEVIFAFFGFNESFADAEGLEAFQENLGQFVTKNLSQDRPDDRQSVSQLVLFSPLAFEDLSDPNLPDGVEHNRRLSEYTRAMAEISKTNDRVIFVDLFTPTTEAYQDDPEPWTINGVHLTDHGQEQLARLVDEHLFADSNEKELDPDRLASVRAAILDKNFYWFNRYRTTDGYNVYGGRSSLKYTNDLSNYEVLQREMVILEAMASERDRLIHALAEGDSYEIKDGTTPEFIPVETNLPGPLPNKEHPFLNAEEAIDQMTLAEGLQVEVFASEEQFPELINPVQMAFDTRDRLWIATWPSYPHWKPKDEMNDQLIIIEDTDGDGRGDVSKVFAEGLHNPTGFEFYNDGVLVAMAPYLLYLKDTDGDDRADVEVKLLSHLDSADTHHTANSFVIGPDGCLYFQEGTFHQSQIETPYGVMRNNNACVWRFDPRSFRVERYIPFNFANPHGHVFDDWGQGIVHDGTSSTPYHDTLFSGYLPFPKKHRKPPVVYKRRTRPCPGTELLSSRHFPERMQGALLVGNVIGYRGILTYRVQRDGSSLTAEEIDPFLFSEDPSFRPSDLEVAPDGSLYFLDWQNPIIGHMQHHLRDPNRDQRHGRVYRVTAIGRPLVDAPPIADQPIASLLENLKSTERRVRYRTWIALSGRETDEVIEALATWVKSLDQDDPEHEHHLLEALWVHRQHHVFNIELLDRVLQSPEPRARAAAVKVLCDWRTQIPDVTDRLAALAADEDSRVRLEAVRAASFLEDPLAIEIPLLTLEFESDQYLDFVREQTLEALEGND